MKALVLAALVLIAGCAHRVPVVGITPGLHPRLTAAAAEQLARDAIDAMDIIRPGSRDVLDVVAITAIPGGVILHISDDDGSLISADFTG